LAPDEPTLPIIDLRKCDGCGKCAAACPAEALRVAGGKVVVIHTDCDYCGECEAACPTGAIACPYEIVWQREAEGGSPRGGVTWP
jgi:ferredoxin